MHVIIEEHLRQTFVQWTPVMHGRPQTEKRFPGKFSGPHVHLIEHASVCPVTGLQNLNPESELQIPRIVSQVIFPSHLIYNYYASNAADRLLSTVCGRPHCLTTRTMEWWRVVGK